MLLKSYDDDGLQDERIVDGLQVGTTFSDRLRACTEEDSSQMGVDPG